MTRSVIESKDLINSYICDISKQSLNFTKEILRLYKPLNKINYKHQDFFDFKTNKKFDLIVMGEVIEHVDKPEKFLQHAKKLLNKNGTIFVSSCANCPQSDHLFHFKNIIQIKNLFKKCQFKIDKDFISPTEDIPRKNWQKEKIAINYCAFLSLK